MQSQNCSWGSTVFSYASCILQGKLEAQIKTKLHLQLGSLKWSLTPCGNTSHAQRFRFFTRPDVRTGLSGITTPHFAYEVKLWVNSLIPLTGKQYKMKEHREKSPIPFFLQTSLSLSYLLHNSMLKELF